MKSLYMQARDANMSTTIATLRKIERKLINDNSDEADMCLPHIEALIVAKVLTQ